jgi:hypothetical protein
MRSTKPMTNALLSADKMNRVVVAFADGQRLKGCLFNFSPLKESFKFTPNDTAQQKAADIRLSDLKAIFFVKDFNGNPDYKENPAAATPKYGRKIAVTFLDGEELSGTTEAYNPQRLGFFVSPADPNSNNLRVFVISGSVRQVTMNGVVQKTSVACAPKVAIPLPQALAAM